MWVLAQSDKSFGDQIVDSLEKVVTDAIDIIPRVFAAIAFLLLGLFISRYVVKLFHRLLKAVSFDKWVDRSGLGTYVERAGYPDSGFLLARIVGFIVTLIFVQLAVDALEVTAVTDLVNTFIEWIPHVIIAILLLVITGAAANFARDALSPTLSATTAGGLALKVIVVAIWVFGGTMAFRELGFGEQIVDQLWTALTTGLAALLVIKFGVGGIWAARDRFWPRVYDALEE